RFDAADAQADDEHTIRVNEGILLERTQARDVAAHLSPYPEELFSLSERPGHLRLYGRESPGSLFRQALVARRQQAHCYSAGTSVEFEPEYSHQMAGLICYYNGLKFHYLHVSHDDSLVKHVRVTSC